MKINKLPASHIAQQLFTAITAAADANEIIESIEISDTEFASLIENETVKSTKSKWYGSNEGGFVMTDIQIMDIVVSENGKSFTKRIPVSCYFCGVKIIRG